MVQVTYRKTSKQWVVAEGTGLEPCIAFRLAVFKTAKSTWTSSDLPI